MAVGLSAPTKLLPVKGVQLATAAAGIRYQDRTDLAVLTFAPGTQCAGVFTQNAFCAAPVTICRTHLESTTETRALIINSGNANAGTGDAGYAVAKACCEKAAALLDIAPEQVLPFSTGVIGELLPQAAMESGLIQAVTVFDADNWLSTAQAIMTTDTVAKGISRQVQVGEQQITITGIAKGSGMIRPDMATMLGFIATDAEISAEDLQDLIRSATRTTFNAVTVDGDTSTNDACVVAATGAAGVLVHPGDAVWRDFVAEFNAVCLYLAQAMVRDGEGATRFVAIEVSGATSIDEARDVAFTVAHSPLVKTALFAADPNWGRILAAVGRAPVEAFDVSLVTISLDNVLLAEHGGVAASYREELGQTVMDKEEYTIAIDLGRGASSAVVWTSDLSHDYVTINAEYRS